MSWYRYAQNNSGGSFIGPYYTIWVEAPDTDTANDIAEQHGVYFNGVLDGRDCECCGDRWDRAWTDYEEVSLSPWRTASLYEGLATLVVAEGEDPVEVWE